MSVKKITSLFIIMLFVSTAFIAVLPETDSSADDTKTAIYCPRIDYSRTDYTNVYYPGAILPTFYAKSTEVEEKDIEFQKFIDGEVIYENSHLEAYDEYYTYNSYNSGSKTFTHKEEKTLIPLNRGTYTIKIDEIIGGNEKIDIYMYKYSNHTTGIASNIVTGDTVSIHTEVFTQIFFTTYNSLSAASPWITVKYHIDPSTEISTDMVVTENEKTVDTAYWTKDYITLPDGDYENINLPSYDPYSQMFKKGSADEDKFIEEIIEKNKLYKNCTETGSPDNIYNSIRWSWRSTDNHLDAGTYTVYSLANSTRSYGSNTINYHLVGDPEYHNVYLSMNKISDQKATSISMYSNSFDSFKIAVSYDKDMYQMYLKFNGETGAAVYVPIESDKLYNIYNEEGRIYELTADYIGSDDGNISMDFFLYTENIPSPDSNTPIFAVLCVIICAIVFGLLFLSGRKPSWSKDPKKP